MGIFRPILLLVLALPAFAQLAPEQKLLDFQNLAALFSKRYAFTEWKQSAIRFDSMDLAPWIARINASKSDLEFFEICAEYVARNQDGHTVFILPSDFEASLPFDVDLYDGAILVDYIDRTELPARQFAFNIGDELVSIDGVAAAEAAAKLRPFRGDGNPRTTMRDSVEFLVWRPQVLIPRAHEIGESANVIIRRQNGDLLSLTIPWTKYGTPYTQAGPSPVPKVTPKTAAAVAPARTAPYMRTVRSLQQFHVPNRRFSVGVDAIKPVFGMPDGFVQRLGAGKYDSLFSGTYNTASGLRIGFLRIPDFAYVYTTDLVNEIKFLEANTDGLVIDVMRNPGGSGCVTERVLSYLNPGGFYSLGIKIRMTWDILASLREDVEWAEYLGASDEEIATLEHFLEQGSKAFAENRGFTVPLPLCSNSIQVEPARDKAGNEIVYTKPIMVLTDELSASAAEVFAAVMQDEKRALLYGMRTDGAGGAVNQFSAGVYTESYLNLAWSILIRRNSIDSGAEFPAMPYIENIGVRPDRVDDYMTAANLLDNGKSFVGRFTAAMEEHIRAKR
jgi:hypothetical protein